MTPYRDQHRDVTRTGERVRDREENRKKKGGNDFFFSESTAK